MAVVNDPAFSASADLGCFIPPGVSAYRAVGLVRLAEELGYRSAQCSHINGHDAMTLLTACAARTTTIRLGTAVVPIYSRTPAAMAQAAATLADVSGGRFALGLGVSHRSGVERWYGQTIDRPAAELREYVRIVRAILAGEAPPVGRKWSTSFELSGLAPLPHVPIRGAALSPGMLRTVGEVCDGAVLWLCVPGYIEEVVLPALAAGRERAGKTMDDFEVVALVPSAVAGERGDAYATLRGQLLPYFTLPFYRAMLERSGFGADVAAYDAAGDDAQRRRAISDDFLDALAAVGSEDAVRAGVARYVDAGVGAPCIWPITGADVEDTLRGAAPRPAAAARA